jgi:hypothetical protein
MKYLDFTIQSIIIVMGLVLLIAFHDAKDLPIAVLAIQLFLGPWQFASSVISVVSRSEYFKIKRTHLIVSSIYLITLVIIPQIGIESTDFLTTLFKIYLTAPAWALATYYYIITWHWALQKGSGGGKFLPHINF